MLSSSLVGGNGDDSIEITADNVVFSNIEGGSGDDKIVARNTSFDMSTLDGGDGNDLIYASGSERGAIYHLMSVLGGNGNDIISLSGKGTMLWNSSIDGGDGNDIIISGFIFGNAFIRGGAGNDLLLSTLQDSEGRSISDVTSEDLALNGVNSDDLDTFINRVLSGIVSHSDSEAVFGELVKVLKNHRNDKNDRFVYELEKFSQKLFGELKEQIGNKVNTNV